MVEVNATPIDLVTPLNASTIVALFGNPSFARPARLTKSRTGSTLEARVKIPFAGYWLTATIWGTPAVIHAAEGEVETGYDLAFSRDFQPIDDDADVAAATELVRGKIMDKFGTWMDQIDAATAKAVSVTAGKGAARLVRRRKAKPTELVSPGASVVSK